MVNFQPCLGLCAKKQKPGQHHHEHNEQLTVDREYTCVACGEVQKSKSPSAFVCRSCQVLNRIGDSRSPLVGAGQATVTLRRMGSGVFQQVSDSLGNSMLGAATGGTDKFTIPSCSVCLDGVGDCVLFPCCHGGFCEDCARHIAGNAAVGGAVCPRCRRGIEGVYRIVRVVGAGLVKVVQLTDLAVGGKSGRQPPKVPPPPGYRKKQNNNNSLLGEAQQ
jgi:hypothetical protein